VPRVLKVSKVIKVPPELKVIKVHKVTKEIKVTRVLKGSSDPQRLKAHRDHPHKVLKDLKVHLQKDSKETLETRHRVLKEVKVLKD
jgi:hypothetical protein